MEEVEIKKNNSKKEELFSKLQLDVEDVIERQTSLQKEIVDDKKIHLSKKKMFIDDSPQIKHTVIDYNCIPVINLDQDKNQDKNQDNIE